MVPPVSVNLLTLYLCILFLPSGMSFYCIAYLMDLYSSLMTLLKCQSQQAFLASQYADLIVVKIAYNMFHMQPYHIS